MIKVRKNKITIFGTSYGVLVIKEWTVSRSGPGEVQSFEIFWTDPNHVNMYYECTDTILDIKADEDE